MEKLAPEEKKKIVFFKALKVHMAKFDGPNNNFGDSTDNEIALMSRKFKQMMKKKGKF